MAKLTLEREKYENLNIDTKGFLSNKLIKAYNSKLVFNMTVDELITFAEIVKRYLLIRR